ncbi:hypothetical protein LJB84_00420 [Bacteroidales bacterium OttesenSCG-928-J19]|nr:hypothetical protein [Bacteroidales bacterium OttesenSCG-928-J19]
MINTNNKFSDDNAMSYEYLIRRAHQCGRYGVAGADADTYRRLLRNASIYYSEMEAIRNKTERKWLKSEQEMLADYMLSCGEVKGYINTAIEKVKKGYDNQLTDEQYNELEEVEVLLISADLQKITDALIRTEKVFLDLKLYPK